jgi:putative transposase
VEAGVFLKLRKAGVERFDEAKGIEWDWWAMDGAITKAPLGAGKNRAEYHRLTPRPASNAA